MNEPVGVVQQIVLAGRSTQKEVDATCIGSFGYHALWPDGDVNITHIPTGYRLGVAPSERCAYVAVSKLLATFDEWDRVTTDFTSDVWTRCLHTVDPVIRELRARGILL